MKKEKSFLKRWPMGASLGSNVAMEIGGCCSCGGEPGRMKLVVSLMNLSWGLGRRESRNWTPDEGIRSGQGWTGQRMLMAVVMMVRKDANEMILLYKLGIRRGWMTEISLLNVSRWSGGLLGEKALAEAYRDFFAVGPPLLSDERRLHFDCCTASFLSK